MPLSAHEALDQLKTLSQEGICPDDQVLESLLVQATRPIVDRSVALDLLEAAQMVFLAQFGPPEMKTSDPKADVAEALFAIGDALPSRL